MILDWSVASTTMVANAVVGAAVGGFVWRRRGATGRATLSVALGGAAVWSFAYGLELATRSLPAREYWGAAKYLGTTVLPPAWLVFTMQYTGRWRRLRLWWLTALAIEPAAVISIVALPATRHFIRSYPPGPPPAIPVVRLGPGYWVHFGYTNAVFLVASVL